MIIEVTQEDIDMAIEADCQRCPVARAIKRRFLDSHVSVGSNVVFISLKKNITSVKKGILPLEASKFISRFDWLCDVEPFSFELEVTDYVNR